MAIYTPLPPPPPLEVGGAAEVEGPGIETSVEAEIQIGVKTEV